MCEMLVSGLVLAASVIGIGFALVLLMLVWAGGQSERYR